MQEPLETLEHQRLPVLNGSPWTPHGKHAKVSKRESREAETHKVTAVQSVMVTRNGWTVKAVKSGQTHNRHRKYGRQSLLMNWMWVDRGYGRKNFRSDFKVFSLSDWQNKVTISRQGTPERKSAGEGLHAWGVNQTSLGHIKVFLTFLIFEKF